MRIFSCIFLLAMCVAIDTSLACDPALDLPSNERDEKGGGKSSGGGGGG